jgi:hypothetical protein
MTPGSQRPHPARDAILDAMRRHGRPISPVQLARITSATLGSTAYRVRALAAAELIELVGEVRGVRGSVEHFYMLAADDTASAEAVHGVLAVCGALTVRHADGGGYPVPTELDDDAGDELPPERDTTTEAEPVEQDSDGPTQAAELTFYEFSKQRLDKRKLEVSQRMWEYEEWALHIPSGPTSAVAAVGVHRRGR